jgi:hypothetical protein
MSLYAMVFPFLCACAFKEYADSLRPREISAASRSPVILRACVCHSPRPRPTLRLSHSNIQETDGRMKDWPTRR